MSWETQAWARQQRTGDPVSKAVLVGIANWMAPSGEPCAVSLSRLADEVEISRSTTQRHIRRLEEMGFLKKEMSKRDNGGQGWNVFTFPHYQTPDVSNQNPVTNSPPITKTQEKTEVSPPQVNLTPSPQVNLTPSPGQIDTPPGQSDTPPRSICYGEGVTADTGRSNKGIVYSPLSPPEGAIADSSKSKGREALPETWTAPPLAELPEGARLKASQWPEGAYAIEAETFKATAQSGSRKRNWDAAWISHINRSAVRVMAEARAGIRHTPAASHAPTASAKPRQPLDRSSEGQPARKIRAALAKRLDGGTHAKLFDECRFDVNRDGLTIVTTSDFSMSYLREGAEREACMAMNDVLGPDAELSWQVTPKT